MAKRSNSHPTTYQTIIIDKDHYTNSEIVDKLYKSGYIKETINYVSHNNKPTSEYNDPDLYDLEQDLCLWLLEMDNEKLNKLFQTGQLRWWITRLIINNINSTTSPYYRFYKKQLNNYPIEYAIDKEENEEKQYNPEED